MGHLTCTTHKKRVMVVGGKVLHRTGHVILADGKTSVPLDPECDGFLVNPSKPEAELLKEIFKGGDSE
jgi:hypothetical protein